MENITPMLKQYQNLKAQYRDSILFFRLGDFYEMFYEDARVSSPILNVVLTSRDAGKTGRIPMCGIPYHAKDTYISKLIKAGMKVAICEQLEDPSLTKGLVKRDVTKIITSGTFIDDASFESRYLLCLNPVQDITGIAFIDASSGHIYTNEYSDILKIIELISRLPVSECIFPLSQENKIRELFKHHLLRTKNILLSPHDDWSFNSEISRKALCEHFRTQSLKGFGIDELSVAISSAGALLEYIKQMNRMPMKHICEISQYCDSSYLYISPAAIYGLGLEDLFKTMDLTLSPLGKRSLKQWIYHPLISKEAINERLDAVEILKEQETVLKELNRLLRNMPDIEKSVSRISSNGASAKDLLALHNSLSRLPEIKKTLLPIEDKNPLFRLTDIPEIRNLLSEAINPDMPLSNAQGKIIKEGFSQELDEIRQLQNNARKLLADLQAREIKRTGINSLKIGYTGVFGYYIEITKTNLSSVPADYIRKQTLVNAERFVTEELNEYEEKMLNAQNNLSRVEKELIENISSRILDASGELKQFSEEIALIDTLYSLSNLANYPGYIRPEISENADFKIIEGRHPVVEQFLNQQFIPNDIILDTNDNHLIILTGPNMSGKSTYIRQNAILAIMAQMGSFIPAKSAKIGLVDKIFTRIGAHDEITKGQSTFMVEMSETADILNNLTDKSLIILDEVGRGTSTYDGLSLAWAIAEHLGQRKTRTLFATHFHELTALADDYPGIKNYNVAVKEWNNEIIFLHKITPGGTDESYGLYVAKFAGIPETVIQRARGILLKLELSGKLHDKIRLNHAGNNETQFSFFNNPDVHFLEEIKDALETLDTDSITPLQALNKLQELKERIKNNGKNPRSAPGNRK